MKLIKTYIIDGVEPTDDEFLECIEIAKSEKCIVELILRYGIDGMPYSIQIKPNATFEMLKEVYESNKYALVKSI